MELSDPLVVKYVMIPMVKACENPKGQNDNVKKNVPSINIVFL